MRTKMRAILQVFGPLRGPPGNILVYISHPFKVVTLFLRSFIYHFWGKTWVTDNCTSFHPSFLCSNQSHSSLPSHISYVWGIEPCFGLKLVKISLQFFGPFKSHGKKISKRRIFYSKENQMRTFFLVAKNVVLMRTLVLNGDLTGSTDCGWVKRRGIRDHLKWFERARQFLHLYIRTFKDVVWFEFSS
jgi:hypothetical protein